VARKNSASAATVIPAFATVIRVAQKKIRARCYSNSAFATVIRVARKKSASAATVIPLAFATVIRVARKNSASAATVIPRLLQ
jgi:hypothetical protein